VAFISLTIHANFKHEEHEDSFICFRSPIFVYKQQNFHFYFPRHNFQVLGQTSTHKNNFTIHN